MDLPKNKGKILTDMTMLVNDSDHVWALGDCAFVPQPGDKFCPPTAQFAIRQAKVLAKNIYCHTHGKELKNFFFKPLGMLGALGHRSAVAELFGFFKFSGVIAWMMWRFIYWFKLPGMGRKLKVGAAWALDMFVKNDAVQLKLDSSQGVVPLHFETDDIIFNQGDIGDYLYIIVNGQVEILQKDNGEDHQIAILGKGEYFGEMALLNQKSRSATVRCLETTDVLALRKKDFNLLIANFDELRDQVEKTEEQRKRAVS